MEAQNTTKMPHFHILVDKYIDWHWMKGAALASGFGCHCFVTDVRDSHVYGYILKYLRKGIASELFLEALLECRGRRVSYSRSISPLITSFSYKPMYLIHSHDTLAADLFFILRWYDISTSVGYYPLSCTPHFYEFFIPSSQVLRLAPPA